VLTPKIATVAARLLDGAWHRVKAVSNKTAASLTTLRAGDRRAEERKGKTESLSKQVEEDEQEEKEAVNLCAFLSPSQIPEERESEGLFAWICDTGTNCF
jgi:transposase-like protein